MKKKDMEMLEELDSLIENNYESIFEKISKTVSKDRDIIILKKIIEKQQKEIEELKEINKEHQLLNGALGFKIGTLESEIEEKTKLINSMKKFLLDIGLMSDYLESEGKI